MALNPPRGNEAGFGGSRSQQHLRDGPGPEKTERSSRKRQKTACRTVEERRFSAALRSKMITGALAPAPRGRKKSSFQKPMLHPEQDPFGHHPTPFHPHGH